MKRSPLRASTADRLTVKLKTCKACKSKFVPKSSMAKACSLECAIVVGMRQTKKDAEAAGRAERKADRAKRDSMKSRSQWLSEAQAAFNRYIRTRDASQPCISCGRFHEGSYDAGHYRSVGAQPALRFDENNVHKQCVPCNQHKGGNIVEYRIRLIHRIGREAVELLEIEHEPAKFTIDDAKRIKETYRAKWKQLTRESA